MNWRGRASALLMALAVTACASLPQVKPSADDRTLAGRLAVRVEASEGAPARSENASFELTGDPREGRLDLATPLGSVMARARWQPGSVVLATPQGERTFASLDELTREVLGESVPVAALFDWLRGRPWSGAESTPNLSASAPGFAQVGWDVDLARFNEGWVVARRMRLPVVTVRARLDKP